jgi:hypothetical protein
VTTPLQHDAAAQRTRLPAGGTGSDRATARLHGTIPGDNGHRCTNIVCGSVYGGGSVQNEMGPIQGSTVIDFSDGPCFWEVEADGNWSVEPRS